MASLRASIHFSDEPRSIVLVPILQETHEHLLLKLAAALFFYDRSPVVISSPQQSPALQGQDFSPDLLSVDLTNQVTLWVECGATTKHKLEKVTKRFREAWIVMLVARPHEGKPMVEVLDSLGDTRVAVWAFREGEFDRWAEVISDKNEIYGEANESELHLVVNSAIFETTLQCIRSV